MPMNDTDWEARPGDAVHETWCGELELSRPLGLPGRPLAADGRGYRRARILVRLHGHPMGFLTRSLRHGDLDLDEIRAAVWEFKDKIVSHLEADGLRQREILPREPVTTDATPPSCGTPLSKPPPTTVVVCTRDRPRHLTECLRGLQAVDYANIEILIVDNAPTSGATRNLVSEQAACDQRIRYVLESRPGLSRARNTGLREAAGEIIAYTDDDVRVDAGWVAGLVLGFRRRPDVSCVTGLVAAASLDSPLEHFFDARISWATSCEPDLFDLDPSRRLGPLYPFAAGMFGTGANFAFRRADLLRLGGFDELLGAGTRTAGGEDLDIFLRSLLAGHALAYEPSALVWHSHRVELAALRRQMFAYGTGLSAYLSKHLLDRDVRPQMLRRVPQGVRHLGRISSRPHREAEPLDSIPRGLRAREFAGFAAGPALYAYSRWRAEVS